MAGRGRQHGAGTCPGDLIWPPGLAVWFGSLIWPPGFAAAAAPCPRRHSGWARTCGVPPAPFPWAQTQAVAFAELRRSVSERVTARGRTVRPGREL